MARTRPSSAERLDRKVVEVFEALSEDAPLRDPSGDLPRHDAVQVRLLAEVLCRLENVAGYLDEYGRRSERTRELNVLELESRLRREAADYLDALGMTPRSRARLGLDLAKTTDLATAMSHPDPERRAELLAEAGIEEEGE